MESFEQALRAELAKLDADLPPQVWTHIQWLQSQGQTYRYLRTDEPFLATMPVASIDDLVSSVSYELPPDLIRYWLGKDGYDRQIIPILRAGGDGSYIALWKRDDAADYFVFLGSEGDAFVVAETPVDLIRLLALGYCSIESRRDLAMTPAQAWADMNEGDWSAPMAVRAWAQDTFGLELNDTDTGHLPFDPGADPFEKFVNQHTS